MKNVISLNYSKEKRDTNNKDYSRTMSAIHKFHENTDIVFFHNYSCNFMLEDFSVKIQKCRCGR